MKTQSTELSCCSCVSAPKYVLTHSYKKYALLDIIWFSCNANILYIIHVWMDGWKSFSAAARGTDTYFYTFNYNHGKHALVTAELFFFLLPAFLHFRLEFIHGPKLSSYAKVEGHSCKKGTVGLSVKFSSVHISPRGTLGGKNGEGTAWSVASFH